MENFTKRKLLKYRMNKSKKPRYNCKMVTTNRRTRSPSPIIRRDYTDDEDYMPINSEESFEVSSSTSESAELTSDEEFGPNFGSILDLKRDYNCVSAIISNSNSVGSISFTFKIENISCFFSRYNKVQSDIFKCRNIPFRLIVHNRNQTLNAFLMRETTTNEIHDQGLEIQVACDITVFDRLNGHSVKKTFANQLFRAGSDWGFSDITGNCERLPGFVTDNSLVFAVEVRADPPYCYSHHSKAITGHVGIRNQGATCYMNSLLQVLFFLTKFRTACYRIPTEMDDDSSMAFALQKVFYNLDFSDTAVCTKNLTKSFGWSNVDVHMQHDIQEMMRVLIDKIESRMKNTLLEPILPSMFQGRFVSYVKCRDIEFSSQREEVFYDIQLSLDNSSNLIEAFKRYVSPEMMDDDNKYHAGDHGLQAAEKGTLFLSLPPVMFLHLLRFQFDGTTSQVMKNNNFFEFNEHIDLTEFVREDESTSWKYTLFAVLSHSGGGSHGHYVAYCNPSLAGKWLKFDDDAISMVHRNDAIDAQFGNSGDVDEWTKSMQFNAYMLVYVRDSMADDIFEPVDPMYITEELINATKKDPDVEYNNNLMNYHFTTEVYVFLTTFLESDFRFPFTRVERPNILPKFSLTRDCTASEFEDQLRTAFNVTGSNQIRIWPIIHSSTHYSYPSYIDQNTAVVPALVESMRFNYVLPHTVWVEMALPGSELAPFNPEEDVLVFYNCYCARECRPFFVHHGYRNKNSTVEELIPILNQLMDWPSRELNIYQVFREKKVCEMKPSDQLSDYVREEFKTYTLHVIFEPKEHDESTKLNSISLYYNDVLFRVLIILRNDDHPKMLPHHFDISLQSTFPEFLDMVARRLNYDKNKIQIFDSEIQMQFESRGKAIPSSSTESLKDLLYGGNCKTIVLFYKLHKVDVIIVETKLHFSFLSVAIDMKKSDKHTLYLSGDETVETILERAAQMIDADRTHGSGKFRLLCCTGLRLSIVKDAKEIFESIGPMGQERYGKNKFYYRIEEIPKGDDMLGEHEKYVVVYQVLVMYGWQPKHVPFSFIFKVNMNESWQSVKDRLRCRLNLSETNWSDYRPVAMIGDDDDMDIDDTKCLNDYEELRSTFSICLRCKSKIKRTSSKVEFSAVG